MQKETALNHDCRPTQKVASHCPFFARFSLLIGLYAASCASVALHENGIGFAINSAHADVGYVYDEAGRLVSAIDATGNTANYAYDAAGNIVSITRGSATQVSISEITPNGGPIGRGVTIYGSGFSATASQNSVLFNGVSAPVSSSSTSSIVTQVPPGATTGPISVTSPNGSAASIGIFTVTASDGAPTVTSFSPTIASAGTAVTVTGTNFETIPANNKLRFNTTNSPVASATPTTINTTVPANAASGRLSVATPSGTAVSNDDFFIPPPPWTVADIEYMGRMAIGSSKVVTTTVGNKNGLLLFDGVAGQRVSLQTSNGTYGSSLKLAILSPNGSTLVGLTGPMSPTGFIDTVTLPSSGTYTIQVDPLGSVTGSITITLYNVPADPTAPIVPGGSPVTMATTVPGQNAYLTFSGNAGQRVSLQTSNGTYGSSLKVSIANPDGSSLLAPTGPMSPSGFIEPLTLPVTGTYTIKLDPLGTAIGAVTTTLYNVPADPTAPIVAGGAPVTMTTTTPGQNAYLTFSGSTGQRISLKTTNGTYGSNFKLSILKPDGSTLVGPTGSLSPSGFIDTQVLPATGTYTIKLDPLGTATGSITVTLYDVPPDPTGTIVPGGPSVPVTTTVHGQNASLTFTGTSGQQVTVRLTGNTMGTVTVKLLRPDGTTQATITSSAASFNMATQTLATSGVYTITINPPGANVGSITVSLTNP